MVFWSWSWRKGNLKDIEANDQMSKSKEKIISGRISGNVKCQMSNSKENYFRKDKRKG
jgi:hypothetical protein